jgi:hypothetical protein
MHLLVKLFNFLRVMVGFFFPFWSSTVYMVCCVDKLRVGLLLLPKLEGYLVIRDKINEENSKNGARDLCVSTGLIPPLPRETKRRFVVPAADLLSWSSPSKNDFLVRCIGAVPPDLAVKNAAAAS